MFFSSITRSYTLAFTMRSGSNEVCNLLAKNALGNPGEYFQKGMATDSGTSAFDAFLRVVNDNQVGGVFGSKMSHDHRAAVDEMLRAAVPGYRILDDVLPGHRWIWLQRRDRILQAISLCRAEASKRWSSIDAGDPHAGGMAYDFFHILSRVMMIYTNDLAWETYFCRHNIQPFVIYYEDFFRNLHSELPKLIDFLGGLPEGRMLDNGMTLEVQRDEETYAWRRRFVNDLGRIGEQSFSMELGVPLEKWGRFFFQYGWRG